MQGTFRAARGESLASHRPSTGSGRPSLSRDETGEALRGQGARTDHDLWLNSDMSPGSIAVTLIVLIAAVCAVAPIPPATVERVYSMGIYPVVQGVTTTVSNQVPFALLDVAVGGLLFSATVILRSRLRAVGLRRALPRATITVVGTTALFYLLFLGMWGLNYRRVPMEQKLDYHSSRLTPEAAIVFASAAALETNGSYAAAHGRPLDTRSLGEAFADVQRVLGASRVAVTGVPKRSLLEFYFRRAAIDGMTDPLFLEIIVNHDVLEFERPFVVAHEWAHLAGYAHEAEANFVAWLTCIRADPPARYSGWLAAYQHGLGPLSRADRGKVKPLDRGPLEDLRAMAARYARSSPAVRNAAREVYDEYLRANRVAEGIASYDAVVRLMIGTSFDPAWTPRRR